MLLSVAAALACPTIATGTPSPLSFDVAQVAIVRQGERTTFSVSVNPAGDPQEFALVLPVPTVLAEDEIATLDPQIFARLDGYSAPRHVADAGCPRRGGNTYSLSDDADSESGGGDDDGGVDVEAEYLVGEYQIVILSAEESAGLQDWLDANGYYLPEGAEPRLAEYIEAGSYFLAAKVAADAALANGASLSPLQISYTSDVFSIPIRLATLNSPGEQDMVIYAIGDVADGQVGIASYPEFDVPDRCVWGDPAADDFAAFYHQQFTAAWTEVGDAGWTREFAGAPYDCNPCTGVYISEEDVLALGFAGDPWSHHLTRIRMRYTPEQADVDLMLYGSGVYEPEVTSYADDAEMNYGCVETFCDGTLTIPPDDEDDDEPGRRGICGTPASASVIGVLMAAMAARRRRG
ncbi:MAG: DUF2330 domain-containing protein [Myxococcota bacterium]